jgi:hypothetical protein
MTPLQEVIVALGGNVTLLLVLGFLSRSLVQTLLAKDIKRFETDLANRAAVQLETLKNEMKAKADAEIERLRSRLQHSAIEHQVRFAKIYEKRAEAIIEIDQRLQDLEIEGQHYVQSVGSGGEEAYQKWRSQFIQCNSFVSYQRLYLTDDLYRDIREYLDGMKEPAVFIWTIAGLRQQGRDLQGYLPQITQAVEDAHTKYPGLRFAIARAFRAALEGSDMRD